MKGTSLICLLFMLASPFGCGEAADRTGRLEEDVQGYCELWTRCGASGSTQLPTDPFADCVDTMTLALAVKHHVFGADCIDASLDQVECRLDYDCDFPDEPVCADGGARCDPGRPCEELVPVAEDACGGLFIPTPDLGIDSEVQ